MLVVDQIILLLLLYVGIKFGYEPNNCKSRIGPIPSSKITRDVGQIIKLTTVALECQFPGYTVVATIDMLEMEEAFHHRNTSQNGSIELQSVNDFGDNDDSQEINPLVPQDEENSKDGAFDDGHGGAAPGSATSSQVVINIIISFVGAGLLGVPNAFMKCGWLLGFVAVLVVSVLNVYAMLRLPAVQVALQARYPTEQLHSYGDIGRCIMGRTGEIVVQMCLAISQAGFGTAYIIFIAANIESIAHVSRLYICLGCIPGLILLVQFRDLKSLSPFSL